MASAEGASRQREGRSLSRDNINRRLDRRRRPFLVLRGVVILVTPCAIASGPKARFLGTSWLLGFVTSAHCTPRPLIADRRSDHLGSAEFAHAAHRCGVDNFAGQALRLSRGPDDERLEYTGAEPTKLNESSVCQHGEDCQGVFLGEGPSPGDLGKGKDGSRGCCPSASS